ncbi:hypothetical protein CONCODRAFT_6497 [Conidiobolus coronatus NRRL 28638]|uniref:C2 domain-containing protein n=1 Tax=Conidiobolus coronatus (strain ATCC 28846 / CBS 209.66 / NRRL 28638) TaxID=796925 RepID=A0A137P794_CONC2|nr:hypothetical protein CONCODRAFT_6497 [Conidiobolus coronatus NRRL 28638]|eukprot:KXN70872.1 hypothetical protein CONCODRAFT_6497 [Conidiobolus coronatus NRRL 28638]
MIVQNQNQNSSIKNPFIEEKMTKIGVDVITARGLTGGSELRSVTGTYLQLSISNSTSGQKQNTKLQWILGTSISFDETFEFDADKTDNLSVKLCEDEFLLDEKLGEVKIPLREVFETGGIMGAWFPIGEERSESVEVLLNIATMKAN